MKRLITSSALAIVFALALRGAHAGDPKSQVEPGAKVKKLADGMKFTDIPNSKLMQWKEGDGLFTYRKSEQANGNILDLEGRLISCQHAARNLVRTEKDGSIKVLADKFNGKRFNSPNDVAVR